MSRPRSLIRPFANTIGGNASEVSHRAAFLGVPPVQTMKAKFTDQDKSVSLDASTRQMLRNYDTFSLTQCRDSLWGVGEPGTGADIDLLSLVVSNLCHRVDFLLRVEAENVPKRVLRDLFSSVLQNQSLIDTCLLGALSESLLRRMGGEYVLDSKTCVSKLRNRKYLRATISDLLSDWNPESARTAQIIAAQISTFISVDLGSHPVVPVLVNRLFEYEDREEWLRWLVQELVMNQDCRTTHIWELPAVRVLIARIFEESVISPPGGRMALVLAAAFARSGAAGSDYVYGIVYEALNFNGSFRRVTGLKLEICRAFRLPSTEVVQARALRYQCSQAAFKFIRNVVKNLISDKEQVPAGIIVGFAEVAVNPHVHMWEVMLEKLLNGSEQVSSHEWVRFVLAAEHANCPTTILANIQKSVAPLAIMAVRGEMVDRVETLLDLLLHQEEWTPLTERMREESVNKIIGSIRQEDAVDVRIVVKMAQVMMLNQSPRDRIILGGMREYIATRPPITDQGTIMRMVDLAVQSPDWAVLGDSLLERVNVDSLTLGEMCLLGRFRPSDEWARRACKMMHVEYDPSNFDRPVVLAQLQSKFDQQEEFARFPDGRPHALTAKAFCGLVASVSLVSSGLGLAEGLLRGW